MPFADAKYPKPRCFTICGDRTTPVPLANGETLLVIEQRSGSGAVVIAIADSDMPDSVDLFVCEISRRGVLAHSFSDEACERIAGRPDDA